MITKRMEEILKSVSRRVEKLVPSGRFYIALFDPKKKELSFPLVREGDIVTTWDSRPCESNDILPDLVVTNAKSLLYENDLSSRFEKDGIRYWPDRTDIPQSWLGVPTSVGDKVFGALVVENWQKTYSFNKNDEIMLVTVARQAAIAIDNVRLYDQLERKVESLRILNEVGRQLASGLVKEEHQILEIVMESATRLNLDTRNMYIAFYDPNPDKPDMEDEIFGMIRVGAARYANQKAPMRNRVAQRGLTEYVIRTRQSFNPPDVMRAYEEHAHESLEKSSSPRALSWLGIPILLADQARGAIVLRNYEAEHVYSDYDQEVLEMLATQAAVALENMRLYQAERSAQEKKSAAEKMAIMGRTAAEFAHKMNNLAGTIPVRIDMAESLLDSNDAKDIKIRENLEKIRNEADGILVAAKEIRESTELKAPERVDVNQSIDVAIKRAENTQKNSRGRVNVLRKYTEGLPVIDVERNSFLDTLTSIIKNGAEAIDGQGTITIETYMDNKEERRFIEIKVSDTGEGIPPPDLPKIFDLFYTTKRGEGLGFGLWRDRMFIRLIGGDIDVESELGKGSTFTIRVPCSVEK